MKRRWPENGDPRAGTLEGARDAVAERATRDAVALETRRVFLRVFPGVMIAMFLAAADQTILASALPTIASSLGGVADVSWVVVAYLLAATVAAPLYGHLGDRFGRRRMLFVALFVFTAASLGCALAPTVGTLVAARAVQGLGGGGLMTLAQAIIGEHVAPRERGRFSAYFATLFALASTSGPVLGAYLTEHFTWRAVFVVNLPLGLLAALLALRVPRAAMPPRERFQPDLVGAALFSVTILSLLYALSTGGFRYGWTSPMLLALLCVAAVGFVLFVRWEKRAADPVIPLELLADPAVARADAVAVCFAASLFGTILYWPLYLQLGRGVPIGESGLYLLPITLSMVVTSATVGRLIARTGTVTLFPQVGLATASVAYFALAMAVKGADTWLVIGLTMLLGAALGMVMPPVQVLVQNAAGRDRLGAATASITLSRALGGAVGAAIAGAILLAVIGENQSSFDAVLRQVFAGDQHRIGELSVAQRALLDRHLADAYRVLYITLGVISACGAAIALRIPKPDWTPPQPRS